ncbi:hypothetical protein HMPREF3104_04885 [Corynebacterium sp. HMSC30G07]|uniref:hypothetical protein n=1 Tax=Corynebacterium sp. HMSC30G07 TaxID=1581072 RepID=UPI0008A30C11|nr:hypothetical protein [Corynebacterium sp. HMSC30G07]OFT76621.1 hypothetical protein HMPREF3104_04885 [Corynebacterium sp. HMSC30G07]
MTNNPANGYPATGYPAPGFQGGPATMTSQQLAQEDQVHNEKQAQGERKRAAMWVKATSALAVIAAIVYAAIKLWTFVPWVVDGINEVGSLGDQTATPVVTEPTQ